MDINDYAKLRDHVENVSGRPMGHPFARVAYEVRTVRGSEPSAAKARQYGTNGKLGKGRITATSASDYTLRISGDAASQAIGRADASVAVSDFMASIGMVG